MTARGIHSCCPEAPTTINVTKNVVELNGYETLWRDEYYTGADVVNDTLTISFAPYAKASVQVILNSGTQRHETDYTISGNVITFTFTPDQSDVIHVRYITVGLGSSILTPAGNIPVGATMGFSSALAPDGWLFMDGSETVSSATYPLLHAFLELNLDLVVGGISADPHTLKDTPSAYYDSAASQIVYGNTIIKHD